MSRLVRPSAYGSPAVLTVSDAPVPHAGAHQVVVQVRAAGVNPLDWKLYSGAFHAVDEKHKDAAGLAASLPAIGAEAAGVVIEVGPGVERTRVGDEVIVYPASAAYADHILAPESSIVQKPASLGWPEAAGLMLTATTAAHALHAAEVGAGDTVLVHGGAGGVGLMALQLANNAGANVIATASPRNHDLIRRLGAEPVAYGPGLTERVRDLAPHGVDAAIDTVGTDEALDVSLAVVADPARVASITGGPRRIGTGVKLLGYGPGQDAGTEYRASIRQDLAEQAASGRLQVMIAGTFPLEQAARAHEAGMISHQPGKLILIP